MKKNFFKKLSFILAFAMIVTALVPASGVFAAKAPKLSATSKTLHLGRDGANQYDFNIANKKSGWKYLWTSSNEDVVKVKASNGLATATGAGKAKVSVLITDKKGEEVDELTASVLVRDNIKELTITNTPAGDKLAVGAENDFNRSYVTEAGLKKGSQAITRWTAENKDGKAEGATISTTGLFVASAAGEYTITARSFQSGEKYNLWLSDSTKYADYVTATATYKVTVAPSIASVKQVDLDTFTVTFDSAVTDAATKLSVFSVVGGAEIGQLISSVTMDSTNKIATVDLYVPFSTGVTYVVKYPDMASVQFVAATTNVEDVVSLGILTTRAQVGEATTIKFGLYNKDGVNIATDDLVSRVTVDSTSNTAAYLSGQEIYMYTVGITTTVAATFHTYNYSTTDGTEIGTLSATGVITCVDDTDDVGTLNAWTLEKTGDAPDFTNATHTIAADDPEYQLFVQLKGTDTDGNTLYTTNEDGTDSKEYFTFVTSNNNVVIVNEDTGKLYPVTAGSCVVVVKYDGKAVGTVTITVVASRKLVNATLSTTSITLSNSTLFDDTATVYIGTHVDQLGDDIAYDYSVSNSSAADAIFAEAALVDSDGLYTFNGNGRPAGTYTFTITITDVNNSSIKFTRGVTVYVKAPTAGQSVPSSYKLEPASSAFDLSVSADDVSNSDVSKGVTFAVYGYAKNNVKLTKQAAPVLTRSNISGSDKQKALLDSGLATGSLNLVGTTTSGAAITVSGGDTILKAPKGTYNVQTKVDGTTYSATVVVTDTQVAPVVTVNKVWSTEGTIEDAIIDCISVTLDGKSVTLVSTDLDPVVSGDTGKTVYVKTATYREELGAGIYINHTLTINRTITYAQ